MTHTLNDTIDARKAKAETTRRLFDIVCDVKWNAKAQRMYKELAGVTCDHGIRYIKRTSVDPEYRTYGHVYCTKCKPTAGEYYESLRICEAEQKAQETREAKEVK